MRIVICGTMVPPELEKDIYQLSNAANRYLMNFYTELCREHEVTFLSYLGIDITDAVWDSLCQDTSGVCYFRKSNDKITGVLHYRKAVKEALKEADCIITYNTVYAWLFVPDMARAMGKKSALILADYTPAEGYSGAKGKAYAWLQEKIIRRYDFVIGLSGQTRKYIRPEQGFIHSAGGISRSVYDFFTQDFKTEQSGILFMYAGVLEPVTGIDLLVRAFCQVKGQNMRLAVSGKGTLEEMIKQASQSDSRILFLGCPPYEEYLHNLQKADVLVNPRNMNLPENQNNFPSKIMEYMATGKPIISTKFAGWDTFTDVICFCDSTEESLSQTLRNAAEGAVQFAPKEQIRKQAAEYLWENQVKAIIEAMCGG